MEIRLKVLATGVGLGLILGGCGAGGGRQSVQASAPQARGPITIWYSNNEQEVAWGKGMVEAWNAAHADEKIEGQEIPAGKSSEEVIGAALTAGTAPCLVLNTAPSAVGQFQRQGGLVNLATFADGAAYIEGRSGASAAQYKSDDGGYYQLPWKANPVRIFYNKDMFKKAGLDPDKPDLSTFIGPWNEFLWPFLVTKKASIQPLAVSLANYIGNVASSTANPFGALLAGAVVLAAPVVVLFVAFQRWFTASELCSGVKG